jgi:hypothetical protein
VIRAVAVHAYRCHLLHGEPDGSFSVVAHIYGTDISRLGSSVHRVYDLPVVAGIPG